MRDECDKETERTTATGPTGGGFISGGVGQAVDPRYAGQHRMKQAADQCPSALSTRMTTEGAIRARIDGLRREIAGLEALLRTLPREMPFEADEALWRLMIAQR